MALVGPISDHMKIAFASTTTDRSIGGRNTGWTNHVTVSFTTSTVGAIIGKAHASALYEQNAMHLQCRLNLQAANGTNYYGDIFTTGVQFTAHYAQMTSGDMYWVFEDMPAGSCTMRAQYRNMGNSSNAILSYFDQGGQNAYDNVTAIYRG